MSSGAPTEASSTSTDASASISRGRAVFDTLPAPITSCLPPPPLRPVTATLEATYPLRLHVPKRAAATDSLQHPRSTGGDVPSLRSACQWLYVLNYGAGLVAGDCIDLQVEVRGAASALVTTQGYGMVYHGRGSSETIVPSGQRMTCRVSPRGFLALVPHPIICFRDAHFKQHQHITVEYIPRPADDPSASDTRRPFSPHECGSVVLLDWIVAGRVASDELWAFFAYETTNVIHLQHAGAVAPDTPTPNNPTPLPLFRDSVKLSSTPTLPLTHAMAAYRLLAIIVLFGPAVEELANRLLTELSRKRPHSGGATVVCADGLLVNASGVYVEERGGEVRLRSGGLGGAGGRAHGVVIRLAASEPREGMSEVERLLGPLWDSVGGNPLK
ncbi:unnamed protein product [Vitrella brassicaformis CCMP3155]|uniref:Urease accessory protein UreD n=1 Tax=Vitrella brassicaformis (strain CCMP3155) TaxID=1169540 RepID=A0A0G4F7G4_VITBC|nr:unnamed protein product [Vitrella brassicaformis CCMP3155]|eukprot:CEM08613.1 unnamed protein product [Vitrella brassicaformis CCMP3155]